jgi:hypothetical protein
MVFIITVYGIDLSNCSNQSNLLCHCMCLSLYVWLLQPLGFPLRVIVGMFLWFARAIALVIVNVFIVADISGMSIFATFLAPQFQKPAVIFYMSITLTVSAALTGLLTARLIANAGLQLGLAGGALSK